MTGTWLVPRGGDADLPAPYVRHVVLVAGIERDHVRARRIASRSGGKALPPRSARRRIPAQAFALKEYRCGASQIRMSDKEHTAASLGHSEELSVKSSPRERIPALLQLVLQRCEGFAFVLG